LFDYFPFFVGNKYVLKKRRGFLYLVEMDETAENLTTFKMKCLLAILVTGLCGGLLPLKLRVKDRLLSLGNTLSGGVFLAAGIAHMFPEAVEGFEKLELGTNLPVAYIFCMFGMLGTFFFEKVVVSGRHNHGAIPAIEDTEEESEPKPTMKPLYQGVSLKQKNPIRGYFLSYYPFTLWWRVLLWDSRILLMIHQRSSLPLLDTNCSQLLL